MKILPECSTERFFTLPCRRTFTAITKKTCALRVEVPPSALHTERLGPFVDSDYGSVLICSHIWDKSHWIALRSLLRRAGLRLPGSDQSSSLRVTGERGTVPSSSSLPSKREPSYLLFESISPNSSVHQ